MLDVVMGYALIAVVLLVPLLLLAGLVWVLIHPLDLEQVNTKHTDHEGAPDRSGGAAA